MDFAGKQSRLARDTPASAIRKIFKTSSPTEIKYPGSGGYPAPELNLSESEAGQLLMIADPDSKDRITTNYSATCGLAKLRERYAKTLAGRDGITVPASEVYITVGSQEALRLTVDGFIDPGDTVMTQAPGYPGILNLLRGAGANVIGIPTGGEDGIDIAKLKAAASLKPKMMIFNPTYTNPDQAIFSAKALDEICAIADDCGSILVEDQAYLDLHDNRDTLKRRKADVVHTRTTSKSLSPFRIGFLVAPPEFLEVADRLKGNANLCNPGITQEIVYQLLLDGEEWKGQNPAREQAAAKLFGGVPADLLMPYSARLERNRANYLGRAETCRQAFGQEFKGEPVSADFGLMFGWFRLPSGMDAQDFLAKLSEDGATAISGDTFDTNLDGSFSGCYRWNFTSMPEGSLPAVMALKRKAYDGLKA